MITDALLMKAAYKTELAASRRLAAHDRVEQAQALRTILEAASGPGGLAALLAARTALTDAAAVRLSARGAEKAAALERKMRRHDGPPTAWTAWFDGSAHPNPGRCGIGGIVTGPAGQRIEISRPAGFGNSSEAEYLALIAVLEQALAAGARELTVYGDSQGVIADAAGQPQAGAQSLLALRTRAQALMAGVGQVSLRWIPRHKNPHADALSQRALQTSDELSETAARAPHPGA